MLLLALIVLALPGLLLAIHLQGIVRTDPVAFIGVTLITAAAAWIAAFWLLPLLPLGLGALAALLAGGSAVGLLLSIGTLRRALAGLDLGGPHRLVLAALAAVAALRLVPFFFEATAPGADMSMHGYMARLIALADGLPPSYRPLLPVDDFGAYAAGFPALGALLGRIAGSDVVTTTHLLAVLTHAGVSFAVYLYCRTSLPPLPSLAGAVVASLVARDPQAHFLWGGNPTVLSLVFVTLGLVSLERLGETGWRLWLVPGALSFAAALQTHSVLPYALVYVLLPLMGLRLYRLDPAPRRALAMRTAALLLLSLVVALPYLLRFELALSPAERAWIWDWQHLPVHVPGGPPWSLPLSVIWHIGTRLGHPFLVLLLASTVVCVLGRVRALAGELLFAAMLLLVVLNALVWLLPASYALYPDRIMLLMILPAARLVGGALAGPGAAWPPRLKHLVATGLTAAALFGAGYWYLPGMREVSVTADDLAVMTWLDAHLPPEAVIANNYGDAGIWIPALTGRPVKTPHVHVVYKDEVEPWRKTVRTPYIFVGARRVYEADSPYELRSLLADRDRYIVLQQRGDAALLYDRRVDQSPER